MRKIVNEIQDINLVYIKKHNESKRNSYLGGSKRSVTHKFIPMRVSDSFKIIKM